MGLIRKIAISIVSIICIVLLSMVMLTISMNQLLYPKIYTNALEKSNFYDSFQLNDSNLINYFVLPETGLKGLINQKIGNLLAYLRADSEDLDLKIYLNKSLISKTFAKQIESVPICSQTVQYNCRVNISEKEFGKILQSTIPDALKKDYIDLRDYDTKNQLPLLRRYFGYYYISLYSLIGLTLIFIIFLLLLNKGSFKNYFRSFGSVFTITGISGVISSFISSSLGQRIIEKMAVQQGDLNAMLKSLVMNIINSLMNRFRFLSFILIAMGLFLLLISFFIKPKNPEKI